MKRFSLPLLSTVILLLVASSVLGQQGTRPDLVLNGKVRNIKQIAGNDSVFIEFVVDLDIEFSNAGRQPIILLRPQPEPQAEIFRLQIESLALSKLQAETYPYARDFWVRGMYTSINTSPEYSEMAKRLDKALPPTDLTLVLKPGESWTWATTCQLLFYQKTPVTNLGRSPSGMDLGWDVISRIRTHCG